MIRALQIRSATTADGPAHDYHGVLHECGLMDNASLLPDMFHVAVMDGRIVALCWRGEAH